MAYDAHANGAYSTVLTAPSPASSGTSLVVQSSDGTRFPTAPFNATVWPAGAQPLFANGANAEIVRVTAISTDTLTIVRAQEGTSARSIVVGDQIAATITAKTLTDIEAVAPNGAWTAYTPTFTAGAGTPTTVTINKARYIQIGKTIHGRIDATVTNHGTASGQLKFTLPVTALDLSFSATGAETHSFGYALAITGISTTQANVQKYDATTVWVDANQVCFSFTYEAA